MFPTLRPLLRVKRGTLLLHAQTETGGRQRKGESWGERGPTFALSLRPCSTTKRLT